MSGSITKFLVGGDLFSEDDFRFLSGMESDGGGTHIED